MIGAGSRSFRTRLVFAAATTVIFVQIIGALIDVYKGYTSLSHEMDAKGELVVGQTAMAISRPLWDFDDILVSEILQSVLKIDDVVRVAIVPTEGKLKKEQFSEVVAAPEDQRIYKQAIMVKDGNTIETLGTFEVAISTDGMWTALETVILHRTILVATILGLASTALYLVLGRLSKPLEDLRNAVYAIEREEFELLVPSRNRKDEIGALANAIEGLRQREAELSILRHANNEKSQREGQRIRQALQSTRDAVVLVDETNTIIFANASAKRNFPVLTIGSELAGGASNSNHETDAIRAALVSRKEMDAEISLDHQDAVRHFQARTGPIVDSFGNDLGGLFLASDITEQFEKSKEASYFASHDPLTGLLNRREMDSALAKWVEDDSQEVGVMLIDLDHFKVVNDNFGHQNGDKLLVEVAKKLTQASQPGDLVIRLGGDEFAIITRGRVSESHLDWIASSAIDALKHPMQFDGRSIQVSISVGIATTATAGWEVQTLLRHADLALYEAKEVGRGRVEIYNNTLLTIHQRRRKMEGRFRDALESDRIFPVYQVQTSIEDGTIVGFESLARWHDPELGNVSPVEFIPLAEKADLIDLLTRKILIETCKTAVKWANLGFEHRIAVNISPKLFNGVVLGLVKDCLALTGCAAESIELEITESVLLCNSSAVRSEINELRSMGITIALDDFGIGYSSLDYLRRFPLDKIKIDRAFVRQVASSGQSRAIVTAISQLGHSLGMKVAGEGAETQEDRMALKRCGVDVVQGFVDGQPTTKSETERTSLSFLTLKKAVF